MQQLPGFVRKHATRDDVAEQLQAVREASGEPAADVERVIEILLGWIAEDRKSTPLKALQGMVWEQGTGPDSSRAMSTRMRWRRCSIGTRPAIGCTSIRRARSRRRS